MMMPYISGLRLDIWAQSSPTERLQALNQLASYKAAQDGRPDSQISSEFMSPYTNGIHYTDDNGVDQIEINSNLINRDTPYQAVETFFHEDRHSHQTFVVSHPEKAENQQQYDDWAMSTKDGYLNPSDYDFSAYRWQPVEADANKVARASTDDLYQNTFHDTQQYPAHKADKEQEIADTIEVAKDKLGEDYEETARLYMVDKYQSVNPEHQQTALIENAPNFKGQEVVEAQPAQSAPVLEEKPEEQTSMPGGTPENRHSIETLANKDPASLEGKELVEQPKVSLPEGNSPATPSSNPEVEPTEENRYEQGYLR